MNAKATKTVFLGSGMAVLGSKSKVENFLWIFWAWHKGSLSPSSRLCYCSQEGWSLKDMHRVTCSKWNFSFVTAQSAVIATTKANKVTAGCITEWAKGPELWKSYRKSFCWPCWPLRRALRVICSTACWLQSAFADAVTHLSQNTSLPHCPAKGPARYPVKFPLLVCLGCYAVILGDNQQQNHS